MLMGVVLTAQLLGISLTLASQRALSGFWERLGPMSFFVLTISLVASAVLCGLRPALLRVGDRTAALLAWLLLVGIAGLVTWGAYTLTPGPLHSGIFADEEIGRASCRERV